MSTGIGWDLSRCLRQWANQNVKIKNTVGIRFENGNFSANCQIDQNNQTLAQIWNWSKWFQVKCWNVEDYFRNRSKMLTSALKIEHFYSFLLFNILSTWHLHSILYWSIWHFATLHSCSNFMQFEWKFRKHHFDLDLLRILHSNFNSLMKSYFLTFYISIDLIFCSQISTFWLIPIPISDQHIQICGEIFP